METGVREFLKLVEHTERMVFLGGAGVSTASGIPDFRSARRGIYRKNPAYSPEKILSHEFFSSHPAEFFEFYKSRMLYTAAKPNIVHEKLAALERAGKLEAVVTQNIDGLHQKAGSRRVYELHGSVERNFCLRCGRSYGLDALIKQSGVPLCSCGGIIRPDVVLYGEQLDEDTLKKSIQAIRNADLLVVGGTSLSVYPAAGLVWYVKNKTVLINKEATAMDAGVDLVLHQDLCGVFSEITI